MRWIKTVVMRLWKDFLDYKTGILIFIIYYIVMHVLFHAFCPLVMFAGLPCAGCGMTRAVFFLVTGQFWRSWRLNPMALPVLLFLAYCAVMRYFLGKKIKGLKVSCMILCLCLLSVYTYRMCTVFPNRPPYVYTAGNFLEKCFPIYGEILRSLLNL